MANNTPEKYPHRRILSVLALVLAILTLCFALTLLILQMPGNLRMEETLVSAEVAISSSQNNIAVQELLRASRYAVSASHWRSILRLAVRLFPKNPETKDYKLFSTLAGRAATALPGNQEFMAYLAWAQLRTGQLQKAIDSAKVLQYGEWYSLWSEIHLSVYLNDNNKTLAEYARELASRTDSEFFVQAAELTGSAEFAVDAALAYIEEGNKADAVNLAEEVMTGKFRWYNPDSFSRYGIYGALSRIIYDGGKVETAIHWMENGLDEIRQQRTLLWEDIQFLGDLYWNLYRRQGNIESLNQARKLWYEAMSVAYPFPGKEIPGNAWRIWLNLAVLEESSGNIRAADSLLMDALKIFPDNSIVKTAWARKHAADKKDLALQLIHGNNADPVLAAAALQLEPEALPPRLYETRLWELFGSILDDSISMPEVRQVVAFIFEYMVSRNQTSSLDVALDRYIRKFPDDPWVLGWRLAADASRGATIMALIRPEIGQETAYLEFRRYASEEGGSPALHDSALFALMAARELERIANSIAGAPESADISFLEPILLETLLSAKGMESTLADRAAVLEKNRPDLEKTRKLLKNSKNNLQKASARAALIDEKNTLYDNALTDIKMALAAAGLNNNETVRLYQLRERILRDLGLDDEADKIQVKIVNLQNTEEIY